MRHHGYEESEKEMSFSGESRQGQALRIMDALSAVDEELLERSYGEAAQEIYFDGKRSHKLLWQYVRPWAAVLCLAVVGVLGWGSYELTRKVNDMPSGGSMNDMAIMSVELPNDGEGAAPEAVPEEGGAAGQAAGGMAEEEEVDRMSQENAGNKLMGADTDGAHDLGGTSGATGTSGNSGMPQREGDKAEEKSGDIQPGAGAVQEGSTESATEETAVLDGEGCPAAKLQELTEAEARSREGLGDYIPEKAPGKYSFESAFCNLDLQEANVTITWSRGMDSILWTVTEVEEVPETVDIEAPKTYDRRLYEIPYAETVPQEYRQSMDSPVFAWEDFTLEAVRSRMTAYSDRGDTDTPRGNFAVLYPNNIVVRFNGRGTAEEIWEMFDSIKVAD